MATKNQEGLVSIEDLPLVLVHHSPSHSPPFKERLFPHFRLLDSADSLEEPPSSIISAHAQFIRAILCFGMTPIASETLSLLPSLELIVGTTAGVDHIDLQECRRLTITVTNTSAVYAEDAADYAVAMLIDVLRRISAADRFVRAGLWPAMREHPLAFKLGGKRVGLVGFGNIGSKIAKRLAAFGCIIAYSSKKKKLSVPFLFYSSIFDLATDSDALIVCCSYTEETHHVINSEIMTALGKEGVIINVGRGSLIDQKELVQFLVEGKIGGAGLDVFENEPGAPEELFALNNVVLSPHRAVMTPESFDVGQDLVLDNLKAFFSNKPLKSVVRIE